MTKHLIVISACLLSSALTLEAESLPGTISGVVVDPAKAPLAAAVITAVRLDDGSTRKDGYSQLAVSSLSLEPGKVAAADFTMSPVSPAAAVTNVAPGGFWKRFTRAYADDWHDRGGAGPDPKYRGYQAPEPNPPFPFTVWPYGGSPVIGQPNTNQPPLMTALYNGPHGEAWQASKIQIYGWIDNGFNVSSSNKGEFANAPAAYYVNPNTISLDQAVLYIERVPDTVQTDHFDWGFRVSGLYGLDYRYTSWCTPTSIFPGSRTA